MRSDNEATPPSRFAQPRQHSAEQAMVQEAVRLQMPWGDGPSSWRGCCEGCRWPAAAFHDRAVAVAQQRVVPAVTVDVAGTPAASTPDAASWSPLRWERNLLPFDLAEPFYDHAVAVTQQQVVPPSRCSRATRHIPRRMEPVGRRSVGDEAAVCPGPSHSTIVPSPWRSSRSSQPVAIEVTDRVHVTPRRKPGGHRLVGEKAAVSLAEPFDDRAVACATTGHPGRRRWKSPAPRLARWPAGWSPRCRMAKSCRSAGPAIR